MSIENEKRLAGEAAAEFVESGMTVGLGTGTTVAALLPALARRMLSVRYITSSCRTEQLAISLGLHVEPFRKLERLDLAIDSADQIAPTGWLNKGKGAAHTREKIIAAASDRFIIIADSTKVVSRLGAPVPLELMGFGLSATLRRLKSVTLREDAPPSPDGGVIADFLARPEDPLTDPLLLSTWLKTVPGVVEHGLFPPELVTEAYVARGNSVDRLVFPKFASPATWLKIK